MPVRAAVLFLVLLVSGCAEETPTGPTPGESVLRASYAWGDGTTRTTSQHHLALRFREGIPDEVASDFLAGSGLEVQWHPDNRYRVYLVRTADAFALAGDLRARPDLIEYVGPAFEVAGCHGDRTHEVAGNRIVVHADGDARSAHRRLERAEARRVATGETGDLYELPWRPAAEVFELLEDLRTDEGVRAAYPDLMGFGCPHD